MTLPTNVTQQVVWNRYHELQTQYLETQTEMQVQFNNFSIILGSFMGGMVGHTATGGTTGGSSNQGSGSSNPTTTGNKSPARSAAQKARQAKARRKREEERAAAAAAQKPKVKRAGESSS